MHFAVVSLADVFQGTGTKLRRQEPRTSTGRRQGKAPALAEADVDDVGSTAWRPLPLSPPPTTTAARRRHQVAPLSLSFYRLQASYVIITKPPPMPICLSVRLFVA